MIIRELGQIKPEIDERAVEVPQDGWNVTSGGVLYTQNASSCSVAAIYSPENNTGWLGHFANVSQEGKKDFEHFIEAIRSLNATGLEAWLSGGSRVDPSNLEGGSELFDQETIDIYHDELTAKRHTIIEALGSLGIDSFIEYDLGTDRHLSLVELDCSTVEARLSFQAEAL